MATGTAWYNLTKPASTENYNLNVWNTNLDMIDEQMHQNETTPFTGATELANGTVGNVPAPTTADKDKFLKGDGTWAEAGSSNVEANPSGTPTDTLETIGINGDIYQLPEGGDTEITGDAEGSVISIDDGKLNAPLKACTVEINPVQDLHGYDHPWSAGCGKNKLPINAESAVIGGITFTVINENGTPVAVKAVGTATELVIFNLNNVCSDIVSGTQYTLTSGVTGDGWDKYAVQMCDVNTFATLCTTTNGTVTANTVEGASYFARIIVWSGQTVDLTFKPMFRLATETDATFEPYSNICPISGWTEANITVADATVNPTVSNTYNIEFEDSGSPLTVYGGTLDTVSGTLTVTDGYIASYNGETLPSTWISDRDVYSAGTTPTTGAEVVYKLATPITISLTPTEITTLYGKNVIWADSGDIAITYVRDTSIAINDALNQSITPTYSSGTKIADYNVGGHTGAIYVQGAGGTMDTLWTGDVKPTSDSMPTVQLAYPLSGYDYIVVEGYGTYSYYTTDAIYKPVIGRTYVSKLNGEISYCAVLTIINDSNVQLRYWGSAGSNTNIVAIYGVKI